MNGNWEFEDLADSRRFLKTSQVKVPDRNGYLVKTLSQPPSYSSGCRVDRATSKVL